MADARRRGDPFDGLNGMFALWIVVATWMDAMTGSSSQTANGTFATGGGVLTPVLAVDAFLILSGLMACRAARGALRDFGDVPRFTYWRILRFAPALLVGGFLFVAAEAALRAAGLAGDASFIAVNGLAIPLTAALIGSIFVGAATVAGAFSGAIGRAGIAAFVAACIAARVTPGLELSQTADMFARIAAAFALGCFLDSAVASGRVSRSVRRIKADHPAAVEIVALAAIFGSIAVTPSGLLSLAPFTIAFYLLVFARKRGAVADYVLCSPTMLEFGRAAVPMIGCAFLITWPVSEFSRAYGAADVSAALILSPLFALAVFGLAFAVRRLVEDPIRDFAEQVRCGVAEVRRELAESDA
ncbi:MAG: hypothetical protein AAFN79_08140 [Pseudomonadota bacterium]